MYQPKSPTIAVIDNPTVIWRPCPGEPREYPHAPYISGNWSHWATFLSPIVWIYLHSSSRGCLPKMRTRAKFRLNLKTVPEKAAYYLTWAHNMRRFVFRVREVDWRNEAGRIQDPILHVLWSFTKRLTVKHEKLWVTMLEMGFPGHLVNPVGQLSCIVST